MSSKRNHGNKNGQKQTNQSHKWTIGPLVRGFFVGFLVTSAIVRIVPINPALAFAIGGAAAATAVGKDVLQALLVAVLAQVASLGVLLIPFGQQSTWLPPGFVPLSFVGVAIGAVVGWWLCTLLQKKTVAWFILAILVAVFIVQGMTVAAAVAPNYSSEPQDEGFAFDPIFFMKVFYLQDGGSSFYPAYGDSFVADSRFDAAPAALAGWRSPTISTLWALVFNNGGQIVYAFVLLAIASMVACYYLASRVSDDVSALVAPALLAPYYLAAVSLRWFTEYEFWAAFVIVAAAVLVKTKRYWPALGLAFLGGAMREWLISGTMASAVTLLLERKWKKAVPWVIATLAVAAVYIANMVFVRNYLQSVGIAPILGEGGRLGGGGVGFILYTLKFCSDFLAHPLVVPYVVFALALVGAVRGVLRKEYYLPMLLIIPLCAFMIFGSGQSPLAPGGWNDYYNAAYWPFALVLVPAAWGPLRRRATNVAAATRNGAPATPKGKKR